MKSLEDCQIMILNKSFRLVILILADFLFAGLVGCAASYISGYPPDDLPDKSGNLLSGQMNYTEVHNTLGMPYISSRYWRIEVFRDSSSQVEIPVAITPWPVPFARIKDNIYRYTLVAYNESGIAEDAATGILRKPGNFRIASPIDDNDLTLHLEAGDFDFISEWEDRYETLLVKPAVWNAYLNHARSSSQCTAVVGCGDGKECSEELSVDGGVSLPVPCGMLKNNLNINPVAALSLSPGIHTFKTSGGHFRHEKLAGHLSGEQSITFSCRGGEVLFFVIDISVKEYSWVYGDVGTVWKINQYNDMPPVFTNREMILFRGEQWIADQEPDY